MSDKKDDEVLNDESSITPNNNTIDFSRLGVVNDTAIENILRIQNSIPSFLDDIRSTNLELSPILESISEQAKKINITLSPTLESIAEQASKIDMTLSPTLLSIAEQAKNIQINPLDLQLNIESVTPTLLSTPELITPFQKESELLEKQNETLELLEKMNKTQKTQFKNQNVILNEIFKIIIELKEEQRLDHPKFDILVKMAEEWGLEDGLENTDTKED